MIDLTDAERDNLWKMIDDFASADEILGWTCAQGSITRGELERADGEVTRTRRDLRAALGFEDDER